MKYLAILIFFIGINGLSCTKKEARKTNEPLVQESDTTIYIKAANFEAIVFKPSYRWSSLGSGVDSVEYPILILVPEENVTPWSPNTESVFSFVRSFEDYWELAKTDSLAKANDKVYLPYRHINNLQYQFVGFIDSLDAKKVRVNFFSDYGNDQWKEKPIIIDDGGVDKHKFIYDVEKDSIIKVITY